MFRAGFVHVRRALYAVAVVGAYIFYVFNINWFSWMLFLVVILMPILSLGISLPMLRRGRITASAGLHEEGMAVSIRPFAGAVNPMRFRLEFRNMFTGLSERQRVAITPGRQLTIPFDNKHCGLIRCDITRFRMLDVMGLFWLPAKKQQGAKMLVRPAEFAFTGYLGDTIETTVPDASGEKQYVDIREYRQGDPIKDIHWKLTARRGTPIVREYAFYGANNLCIALPFEGDADSLTAQLGRLMGLLRYLEDTGYSYHILWLGDGPNARTEGKPEGMDIEEYIDNILWDVLSRPAPNGGQAYISGDIFASNAHVLEVRSDSVIHHEEGFAKEAYA